ncbi:MAG TPA: 4Fe-4S dicluster domain-containing protein [Chloroflexia bacterium]|nr:4Fe-4S dicluster domain-containing protein [Chloroflexia bacterium]
MMSASDPRLVRIALISLSILTAVFWIVGLILWIANGDLWAFIRLVYLGTGLGITLGIWFKVPRRKRPKARRWVMFVIGSFFLIYIIFGRVGDIQIEGFFFALATGILANAFNHYMIGKIIGPVFFGRIWCGWACWTMAFLDLLPFKDSDGRIPGKWSIVRYAHFGLSLFVVGLLVFGFGYGRFEAASLIWLGWFLAGCLLYYLIGIVLAFALRDNRAFCKYVCPNPVLFKLGSRFSLLKVKGNPKDCDDCDICSLVCPMDVNVADYVKSNRRVLSTECILCQDCITACPHEALNLSFGLDLGGKEWLHTREQKDAPKRSASPELKV